MQKKILNFLKIIGYIIMPFALSYIFSNILTLIGITDLRMIKNLSVISSPLLFLFSYMILKWIKKERIIENDFNFKKGDGKKIIKITLLSLAINFIIALIFINKIKRQDTLEILGTMNKWIARLTAIILAPICEEFYFRKGLYELFDNKKLYIIFGGLIFGLTHYSPGNPNFTNLILITTVSLMGMLFCYVYKKEKRVGLTIIPHIINNMIAMI